MEQKSHRNNFIFSNLDGYFERMKKLCWEDWDDCITHNGTRKPLKWYTVEMCCEKLICKTPELEIKYFGFFLCCKSYVWSMIEACIVTVKSDLRFERKCWQGVFVEGRHGMQMRLRWDKGATIRYPCRGRGLGVSGHKKLFISRLSGTKNFFFSLFL